MAIEGIPLLYLVCFSSPKQPCPDLQGMAVIVMGAKGLACALNIHVLTFGSLWV